jgi:hypothetical protein
METSWSCVILDERTTPQQYLQAILYRKFTEFAELVA